MGMKKITTTLFAVIISVFAFASGHTASTTQTNISCHGLCDGIATGSVTGGIGPYGYSWTGPSSYTASGTNIASLCAGTYTLTVIDSSDMSTATATAIISDPPVLNVTISGGGGAICSSACTSLIANPSGGTMPHTFLWAPLLVTSDTYPACPTATTTYTVVATDSHGCTATSVTTLSVNPTPIVTVNSPTICAGGTVTLTAPGATTYTWTSGATITGVNTATVTPATTTSYTVTGSSLGCTASAVSTVTVQPLPIITVNSPTICAGGTATLIATGATTYIWTAGAFGDPALVTPATTTSYTVTGTTGGCIGTAVSTVTVNPTSTVTVTSPTICSGDTATLTATVIGGATTYTWTAGATSTGVNTATVTPMTTTSYTVTAASLGCTATAISTVTVNPSPTAIVPANTTVCVGSTVPAGIFSSTPAGSTFAWANSNTAIGLAVAGVASTPAFTAINTGTTPITSTITVTPTYAGCTGTPSTYTITVNPLDDASFNYSSPSYCLAGTNPIPLITGVSPGIFSVSPPTLIFITTATGEVDLAGSAPGTYTITYTTGGTCSNSSSVSLTIDTVPVISIPPSYTVCSGMTILIGTTPVSGYTYNWSPNLYIPTSGISNPTCTPLVTTTYTFTETSPDGCSAMATTTVYVDALTTTASSTNTSACGACDGSAIASPIGGTSPYTYNWMPGITTIPVYPGLCAGTYTCTITDSNGCTATDSATVYQPNTVISNFTMVPDSLIAMNYWTLNTSIGAGLTYSWDFGDGGTSTLASPSHTYASAGTYNVCLNIISSGGCTSSLCHSITVSSTPASCVALFNIADDTASTDPYAYAIYNVSYGATLTYSWDFGDGTTSTLQNPTHVYSGTGPYLICLTVNNGSGCIQTYCDSLMYVDSLSRAINHLSITVIGVAPPPEITTGVQDQHTISSVTVFPNPFTDNTTFIIESDKLNETYSFELTDVLGKKVRSITGISDKQFTVSRNGLENGVYFYKIYSSKNVVGIGKLIIN